MEDDGTWLVATDNAPQSSRRLRTALGVRKPTVNSVVPFAIAGIAMVVACYSGARPTDSQPLDLFLTAAVAGSFTLAAARASRFVLLPSAGIAAAFTGVSLIGLVCWLGLVATAFAAVVNRRSRRLGTVVGAIAVNGLLRLSPFGFFGLPSLVAGIAIVTVLVSGYRNSPSVRRQLIRRLGLVVVIVGGIAATTGIISLITARSDVQVGITSARRAFDAARAGDTDLAIVQLERAETGLRSADQSLGTVTSRALRIFPFVAQHHRAIEQATGIGAELTSQARVTLDDLQAIEASVDTGSPDLALLRRLAPRLSSTAESLTGAQTELAAERSPWLLSPLVGRLDELAAEIDELLPEVNRAADAANTVPAMLGLDAPQRYLVFFGTPAESREFGGFVGSWSLIEIANGDIRLIESGRKRDLWPFSRAAPVPEIDGVDWYLAMARPNRFPENLTSSPDPFFVADMTRQVLGGLEPNLAGLIYIDAVALIDVLEITGPVDVPGTEEPLTPETATDFFFRDQYEFVNADRAELFGELTEVADAVLSELTSGPLPGPEELGRVLGPAARGGHLQMVTFNDEHNAFLQTVKLLRPFGRTTTQDFVGVVQANSLANKMDIYLQRALDYQVSVDQSGLLSATASVTLHSDIPSDAPEYALGRSENPGLNSVLLSLYSANNVVGATVDGQSVTVRQTAEFGLQRSLVEVDVLPDGEPVEVVFTLEGEVGDAPYSLEVWRQALINTDEVSISYRGPDGSLSWMDHLVETVTFALTVDGVS